MGRLSKIHWVIYCALIFIISRLIMLYQYDVANMVLHNHHSDFFTTMCKWDCKWYVTIIQDGYDSHVRTYPKVWRGLANWAFFPLYPLLVKLIVFITRMPLLVVGIILNQIFIFLSLLTFYRYLKLTQNEINSRFGVLLLGFSPFSIYFASLYTEATFLLLSLLSFYYLKTKRELFSVICGGLLSATRPVGFIFGVVFGINRLRTDGFKIFSPKVIVLGLISVSGLLLYMLYLYIHTGDFLAFLHIQRGWGRKGIDSHHFFHQLTRMIDDSHNFVLFILSVAISILLFWNKYFDEALFNLLGILPGVLTGQMMSEGRFSGTLFTFYLGMVVVSQKSNSMKILVAALFLLFYITYFLYWIAKASFLI